MHVAIITNGLTALAGCHLELAGQLQDAGHDVTVVCPRRRAGRFADNGLAVVELDGDDRFAELVGQDPVPTRPWALVGWVRRRRRLRRTSIADDELVDAVRSLAPDVVLLDIEAHAAIIATAGLGMPRALVTSFFSIFRRPGLPPLSSDVAPGGGTPGAVRRAGAWARIRAGSVVFRLRNRFGLAGVIGAVSPVRFDTISPVDLADLARHHGVDLAATMDRGQWLRPFVARDLPIICCNQWEMELPHDPPDRVHYVGPMIRLDRREPALDGPARRRWDDLVAARHDSAEPRPLAYCTLGTVWSAGGDLLRRIIAAFDARPDWDLVIGLGGVVEVEELGPVPDNVLVLPWAPQLEILAEADVAITHGGTASLREAVAYGVPTVAFSISVNDQDGNTSRAVHHHLGVRAGVDDPPPRIEAAVEWALTDTSIAEATAHMGSVVRHTMDRRLAVPIVEGLVRD